MKLENLKKGDIIKNVMFGYGLHKAKVCNNFPENQKIEVKLYIGWFNIFYMKQVFSYNAHNFDLVRGT